MSTETPIKETPHRDVLGRPINIGDFVVISYHNGLKVCKVGKSTPKMVRVFPVNAARASKGYLKYGNETVVVAGEDVFVHVLSS